MKIGSTFSGIGALDLACEKAFGGHTIWQIEGIDLRFESPANKKEEKALMAAAKHGAFNRRVLAARWPETHQLSDIRSVNFSQIDRAEVICGGFPCQDLSVAGKRVGLDGKRSGLYSQLMRSVWQQMPSFIVIENVPGLLKYEDRLNRELREIGYGAIWQTIRASNVGAPHGRRRVFVLGIRGWGKTIMLPALQKNEVVFGGSDGGRLWPTPSVCGNYNRSGASSTSGDGLATAVRAWPTPLARDFRSSTGRTPSNRHTPSLPEVIGMLNPDWVELLMGLPSGWTDLSATPDLDAHRWPSGRGEPQHDGEPLRWVPPRSVVDRAARLRSLGNSVVWQQAHAAIVRCLDEYRKG